MKKKSTLFLKGVTCACLFALDEGALAMNADAELSKGLTCRASHSITASSEEETIIHLGSRATSLIVPCLITENNVISLIAGIGRLKPTLQIIQGTDKEGRLRMTSKAHCIMLRNLTADNGWKSLIHSPLNGWFTGRITLMEEPASDENRPIIIRFEEDPEPESQNTYASPLTSSSDDKDAANGVTTREAVVKGGFHKRLGKQNLRHTSTSKRHLVQK